MAISAEAKGAMRANLELEIAARKDKLLAMCDAQCASLRSRLERRVNRVPSNKRNITLLEILEPPPPQKAPPAKKLKEVAPAPAPRPISMPVPAPAPAARRGRAATTTSAVPAKASRAAPKAAAKPTRGVKRVSDEISADDKENNADLAVPKKRTKATAAAPRATRATRAASKKDPSPQILSPKPNNARPAAQATRTRRAAR